MNRLRCITTVVGAMSSVVAAASCGVFAPDEGTCILPSTYGIVVYVKDSATGAWNASGAHIYARSGSYVDSTTSPSPYALGDSLPLFGALNRAGIFQVTVRKQGYRDWVRSVWITMDHCNAPRPATFTARLQRSP